MSKRKFKPGDKVICINNSNTPYDSDTIHPEVGKKYTVRKYGSGSGSGLGVLLVEIVNPIEDSLLGPCEATFHQNRFIKIDDESIEIEFEKKVVKDKEKKTDSKILVKELSELVLEN